MIDWQDLVLTAGTVVFLVALIPTIIGAAKPACLTSASTGAVLLLFAATYLTLSLYFTAVVTALTGVAWLTIFVQSVKR